MKRSSVIDLRSGDTVRLRGSRKLFVVDGIAQAYRKSPGSEHTELRIMLRDDVKLFTVTHMQIAEKK